MVNQIQSRPSRPNKNALRGGEDPFDEDLLSSLGLSREDIEGSAVGEAVEAPHSLGNPINWKLLSRTHAIQSRRTPHSLGNLINWKRF